MFTSPDEVLPDHKRPDKRALLLKNSDHKPEESKPKSHVPMVEVVVEVEISDGFIDIVTIMTAPDRSMRAARDLKNNWPEGQQRTEQAVNSPHPLTAEAANPEADSPDTRPVRETIAQPEKGSPSDKASSPAEEAKPGQLPEILRHPKKLTLAKMGKAAGLKKGSPGYESAVAQLEPEYYRQVDSALASLPFEQFHALNKESPEGVNRQAWQALRKEHGIEDALVDEAAPENSESGPFGPILREFYHDASGAIAKLTELQDGEAVAALHHPEVGDIDLVWGSEGTGKKDGMGLSKLLKYHSEVTGDLQGFISGLKKNAEKSGTNRVRLESPTGFSSVRLDWDGKAKTWLMTAFEKKVATSTRTDTASSVDADDTARRNNDLDETIAQPETGKPTSKQKASVELGRKQRRALRPGQRPILRQDGKAEGGQPGAV